MRNQYDHWGEMAPALKRAPKEHMKSGRLFFEAELDDELLPHTVEVLGNRVLAFASDFPHFTRLESEERSAVTADYCACYD